MFGEVYLVQNLFSKQVVGEKLGIVRLSQFGIIIG